MDPRAEAPIDAQKRLAGTEAVDAYVRDGMCVGLGTGTTAYWAIRRVGERVREGWRLTAVATSLGTERLCTEFGVPLVPLLERPINVAIDGADEVDGERRLIKGGGGALFREKSVALVAERFVVIVTQNKVVERLGAFPLPVEVVPFARTYVERAIHALGGEPQARVAAAGGPFVTDNGNAILDCCFGAIDDPAMLEAALKRVHGVVESGLFVGLVDDLVIR